MKKIASFFFLLDSFLFLNRLISFRDFMDKRAELNFDFSHFFQTFPSQYGSELVSMIRARVFWRKSGGSIEIA